MAVSEKLQELGSWGITLAEHTPRDILDRLEFFTHVAVTPRRVDARKHGDSILSFARYAGVVRKKPTEEDFRVGGPGLAMWLGDEQDKGYVFESSTDVTGLSFAAAVRKVLPPTVTEGTLHTVSGTASGDQQWKTPRQALDYICSSFGAEWRVNPDGSLDAGEPDQLYDPTPSAVVARELGGDDLEVRGLPSDKLETEIDADLYSTRVVLLAEGSGDHIVTGADELASVPYTDLQGNPVKITRLINESETPKGSATSRAQLHLNRFAKLRQALNLSTETHAVEGRLSVGDWVWVYDPDLGLVDETVELRFRGRVIHPVKIRLVGLEWPVEPGVGVYHRDASGGWVDLSEYVQTEDGGTDVEVGEWRTRLRGQGSEAVRARVDSPDEDPGAVPDAPGTVTPWTTDVRRNAEGQVRARLRVEWDQPLNTDGSTIVDGAGYRVRYRHADDTEWSHTATDFSTTVAWLVDLDPGETYRVQIAAFNVWGRQGAWSAAVDVVTESDTIPPATPDTPTLTPMVLLVFVEHKLGKASTASDYDLPLDLDHLEVHISATSGFTPDATSRAGKLPANAGMLDAQVPAVGTFEVDEPGTWYVRLIAEDRAGNRSSASAEVSVVVGGADSKHIENLAITNAKIADLAVSDAKVNDLSAGKLTSGSIEVGADIESSNWVNNESGWRIQGDGVAEFNDVTVRGLLEAGEVRASLFRTSLSGVRVVIDPNEPGSVTLMDGSNLVGLLGRTTDATPDLLLGVHPTNSSGVAQVTFVNDDFTLGGAADLYFRDATAEGLVSVGTFEVRGSGAVLELDSGYAYVPGNIVRFGAGAIGSYDGVGLGSTTTGGGRAWFTRLASDGRVIWRMGEGADNGIRWDSATSAGGLEGVNSGGAVMWSLRDWGTATGGGALLNIVAGGEELRVTLDDNVSTPHADVTARSFNATSDERVKHDIEAIPADESWLEKVRAAGCYRFYLDGNRPWHARHVGPMAADLPSELLEPERDENGEIPADPIFSLRLTSAIGALWAAVAEIGDRLEAAGV